MGEMGGRYEMGDMGEMGGSGRMKDPMDPMACVDGGMNSNTNSDTDSDAGSAVNGTVGIAKGMGGLDSTESTTGSTGSGHGRPSLPSLHFLATICSFRGDDDPEHDPPANIREGIRYMDMATEGRVHRVGSWQQNWKDLRRAGEHVLTLQVCY